MIHQHPHILLPYFRLCPIGQKSSYYIKQINVVYYPMYKYFILFSSDSRNWKKMYRLLSQWLKIELRVGTNENTNVLGH